MPSATISACDYVAPSQMVSACLPHCWGYPFSLMSVSEVRLAVYNALRSISFAGRALSHPVFQPFEL